VAYCVNPWCRSRQNFDNVEFCAACQQPLLVNGRFKCTRPIMLASRNRSSELLEAVDTTGSFVSPAGTIVVLKTLMDEGDKIEQLFRREAESLCYFDHPGIPKSDIEDLFRFRVLNGDEFLCFSMSKIDGVNLEEWIKTNGAISQPIAIAWLKQMGEILLEVHSKGWMHRDIKPSNIMVQTNGNLALVDFGSVRNFGDTYLAKVARDGITQTRTVGFSPPEQLAGKVVPQSDFYALGRTLIYCVTGKSLMDIPISKKTGKMLWQVEAKQIDLALASLIENLIQPSPKDRPKNAQEIIDYLNNLPKFYKNKLIIQIRKNILKVAGIFVGVALSLSTVNFLRVYQAGQMFQSASAHADAEEWAEAKGALQKSLDLNPTANGHAKLGEICYSMHDIDCARLQFDKAIAIAPQKVYPYLRLGRVYEDIADYQNAEKTYLQAIEASGDPAPKNSLARLLIVRENYDAAEKILREALRIKNVESFYRAGIFKNLAWISFGQRKYGQAVQYASESIRLDSEFVVPYCLRAVAQFTLKRDSESDWNTCLTMPTTDFSEFSEVIIWRTIYQNRTLNLGKK
jgi:serine/threonine protein kinase